jgi:hypothetical protein
MKPYETNSPVIFCIFNRPETTQRVFEQIARAKPPALYVVADAAREDVPQEDVLSQQCKDIVEQIDWPCEVNFDYAKRNMGCKQRIYTGISNAFKLYDFAIILEDDCLPSPDFFRFVDTMRERYQDDEKVMTISGTAFVRPVQPAHPYYHSAYPSIWGWAAWKRAWLDFDLSMLAWPELRAKLQRNLPAGSKHFARYLRYIDKSYEDKLNTWDYPFIAHIMKNGGHNITPLYNLVLNIGFGPAGTHTKSVNNIYADMPYDSLPQEIPALGNDSINSTYSTMQIDNSLYRRNSLQKRLVSIARILNLPYSPMPKRPKH